MQGGEGAETLSRQNLRLYKLQVPTHLMFHEKCHKYETLQAELPANASSNHYRHVHEATKENKRTAPLPFQYEVNKIKAAYL